MKRGRKLSRERIAPLTPQERAALEEDIFSGHELAAQANKKIAQAAQRMLRAGRNGDESGMSKEVATFLRKVVDGLEGFVTLAEEGAVLLKGELKEGAGKKAEVASSNGHGGRRVRLPPGENRADQKTARRELVVPYALTLIDTLGPVGNRYIVDHMTRTHAVRRQMKQVALKAAPQGIGQIMASDPRVIYDSKAKVWMRAGKAGAEVEAKKEDAG